MASSARDVASGYASYAGAGAQFAGSVWANQSNRDAAAAANATNIMLQERQHRFQQRETRHSENFARSMSNTAMRRMVLDMKKAGINPILGVPGGGASSPVVSAPSGAGATAQASQVENPFQGLAATAYQAEQLKLATERQKEELKNLASQTRKSDMETKVMSKGIPEAEAKNLFWNSAKDLYQEGKKMFQQKPLEQKGKK